MWCIVGKVGEERLFGLYAFLHEAHGLVGEVVDAKAFSLDKFAIPLQRRAEVVAPVSGTEAIILIEAAAIRVVRELHAVMPFSKGPGAVARRLEKISYGGLVKVQSFPACRGTVYTAPRVVATSEKLSPGG